MESIIAFVDNQEESMETDTYSGFTATEKYENYMQILYVINFLKSNGRVTEDWVQENMHLIEKWRDWIGDYSSLHPEVTDKVFRKACCDTETLIQYLVHSIRTTKTFDTKVYLVLANKLKYICDSMFEEGELENLMSNMGLQ
jgi:hypothetical protein